MAAEALYFRGPNGNFIAVTPDTPLPISIANLDVGGGLPDPGDEGQVLTLVDEEGNLIPLWVDPASGLPPLSEAADGSILRVTDLGGGELEAQWYTPADEGGGGSVAAYIWDTDEYVPGSGSPDLGEFEGTALFIGPEDPTTATGGRDETFDIWFQQGGEAGGGGAGTVSSYVWDSDESEYVEDDDVRIFVGPEDPTTADGGRDEDGDIWIQQGGNSYPLQRSNLNTSGTDPAANSATYAIVPGQAALDVPAVAGDVLEIEWAGSVFGNGSTRTMRFLPAINGSTIPATSGVGIVSAPSFVETPARSRHRYIVQGGDITDGVVSVAIHYLASGNANVRVDATAVPLFSVTNWGQ